MGNASSELQHIANALSGMAGDEKRFVKAVFEGNVVVARDILMANPNVIFARTPEWQNAWHIAAHSGSLEMLEVLHRHSRGATRKPLPGEPAPVNHKNKEGMTPLMVAVYTGRDQVMLFLISVGAEMRAKDMYGNTCVHYAALQGHIKILELLLATSEAEEEHPHEEHRLAGVQELRQIGKAARILGAGAASQLGVDGLHEKLATGRFVEFRNESGLTPMHFAVWGGHKRAVQLLASYGATLEERSGSDSTAEVTCNGGSTALHLAGLRNNVNMVQFLLERHVEAVAAGNPSNPPVDPRTIKDNYNFTPHQLAKNLRREDVLPLLDPRGKLPSLESILLGRAAVREASIREASIRKAQISASASDDGTTIARVSFPSKSSKTQGTEKQSTAAASSKSSNGTGDAWDPFGTGAFAIVPVLAPPPPPAKKPELKGSGSTGETVAPNAIPSPTPPSNSDTSPLIYPPDLICPITNAVMDDPVVAADGRSYERTAIEMWLDIGNTEFPGGGVPVTSMDLVPNDDLKDRIVHWRQQHPNL